MDCSRDLNLGVAEVVAFFVKVSYHLGWDLPIVDVVAAVLEANNEF